MQIEVRHSWQGAVSQQDLSATGIELTDTELAAIYGGQGPAIQQQVAPQVVQQVNPQPQQQQQAAVDPALLSSLASEASAITYVIGGSLSADR